MDSGYAVLGSILTSAYGNRLTEGLAGAAKEAFVHGMDVTVAAGGCVLLPEP